MKPAGFVARLRHLLWVLHGALIVALFAIAAGRGTRGHLVLALLAVLPLLAPLPGLLRARAYTAAWASMIVAFYCALLLAEAYMFPSMKGALVALAILAALDFVVLMLYAKVQARADRLAGTAGMDVRS